MTTIREIAACLFLSPFQLISNGKWQGVLSLQRDFLGYTRSQGHSSTASSAVIQTTSLLRQIRAVQGRHFHINLIRVGTEGTSHWFSDSDERNIDRVLHATRDIFAQAELGIGRVLHYHIPLAQAGGYAVLDTSEEASDLLCQGWGTDNNGLDVFLVRQPWEDEKGNWIGGTSPVGGSCNKDDKGSTALVVVIQGDFAKTLAHEIGHYFGLEHLNKDPFNVMSQASSGTNLTPSQRIVISEHCFVRSGC
ncbi:MAG: hypothetical protein IAE79_09035 [Anaerolinea sp.]|nr:hypothetical protein [Anaerolinea sp.]